LILIIVRNGTGVKVARGEADKQSDVDLVAHFEPSRAKVDGRW